ncbi:MAG TPA: S41 family peptidase [Limnochordia bacterium]|nr:S41 family peptidase [Limnochordia bacterium]
MISRRRLLAILVVLMVAGSAALWSAQIGAQADSKGQSLRTVLEVISLLKTQYIEDVDTIALISGYIESGTINGMIKAAIDDPYTRYLDAKSYEQMQIDTHGEYGGIGIMVGIKDDKITVVAPFEGTPGYLAGLRPGDEIVSIDGKSTELMSLDEAVGLMRGPEGSSIILGIRRKGGEPFEVEVSRQIIQVPSVTDVELFPPESFPGQPYPFGYIRLQRFSEKTDAELAQALERLGGEATGLILDLRDNPGGTLGAAIDVANRFLPDGPIVHIVGRDGQRRTIHAFRRGTQPRRPMVVLVNEYSASASEIVSGALQDRGYAVLVGMPTFGKGLVQTVIPLRDGSALSLTSARYETAGGRDIHKEGIEPDYIVEMPDDFEEELWGEDGPIERPLHSDPQFLKAVEVLMEQIGERARIAG